jgi:hypothetical protein
MFYVAINSKGMALTFADTNENAVRDAIQREFDNHEDFEIQEFESRQDYLDHLESITF